jgi:hypothetical protein
VLFGKLFGEQGIDYAATAPQRWIFIVTKEYAHLEFCGYDMGKINANHYSIGNYKEKQG